MKQGGVSWNTSPRHKGGMITRFICSECGRHYKVEWAKANHQKLCKAYNKKWKN